MALQPVQHDLHPFAKRIDIEGGDFHGRYGDEEPRILPNRLGGNKPDALLDAFMRGAQPCGTPVSRQNERLYVAGTAGRWRMEGGPQPIFIR